MKLPGRRKRKKTQSQKNRQEWLGRTGIPPKCKESSRFVKDTVAHHQSQECPEHKQQNGTHYKLIDNLYTLQRCAFLPAPWYVIMCLLNLHSFNNRAFIKEECAILCCGRLTLTICWVINEVRLILQASVGTTIRYLLLPGTCNDITMNLRNKDSKWYI